MYNHCCKVMAYYAQYKDALIDYDIEDRSYSFILHDDPDGTRLDMYYCPWCGTKIPKDIRDEWIRILETEFGIKEPYLNREKVPKEFLSDEWWKKRRL